MYHYCAYANFPNIWFVNNTGLLNMAYNKSEI